MIKIFLKIVNLKRIRLEKIYSIENTTASIRYASSLRIPDLMYDKFAKSLNVTKSKIDTQTYTLYYNMQAILFTFISSHITLKAISYRMGFEISPRSKNLTMSSPIYVPQPVESRIALL